MTQICLKRIFSVSHAIFSKQVWLYKECGTCYDKNLFRTDFSPVPCAYVLASFAVSQLVPSKWRLHTSLSWTLEVFAHPLCSPDFAVIYCHPSIHLKTCLSGQLFKVFPVHFITHLRVVKRYLFKILIFLIF